MTTMTPQQMVKALDEGLEEASRWPRLLWALDFDPEAGRPGPILINRALEKRGFRAVLDESVSVSLKDRPYPESWWPRLAQEITGRPDANANDVIATLTAP